MDRVERGRKLCLVSHCFLNCNSKVEGFCRYKGALKELIYPLIEKDYGIIQLPCPEATYYGMKRWGHVKEQFDNVYFRKHCRKILEPIIEQILDYKCSGYDINYVLGVNGSPSCGIDVTCSSSEWMGEITKQESIEKIKEELQYKNEPGVFMEELMKMLCESNIEVQFMGIYEGKIEEYDFYNIFK